MPPDTKPRFSNWYAGLNKDGIWTGINHLLVSYWGSDNLFLSSLKDGDYRCSPVLKSVMFSSQCDKNPSNRLSDWPVSLFVVTTSSFVTHLGLLNLILKLHLTGRLQKHVDESEKIWLFPLHIRNIVYFQRLIMKTLLHLKAMKVLVRIQTCQACHIKNDLWQLVPLMCRG